MLKLGEVTKAMIFYTVILFITSALFIYVGIEIYRGNTDLINDYHRTEIKESDRKKYGKAFSKGLFTIAFAMILSGASSLFGKTDSAVKIAVCILTVGIIAGVIIIIKTQKKYNSGK